MVLTPKQIPGDPFASVFGKIRVSSPGETWPIYKGIPMMPVCQLNLGEIPKKPHILSDLSMITVFLKAEEELPDPVLERGAGTFANRWYFVWQCY